jgi:hypothetical protein
MKKFIAYACLFAIMLSTLLMGVNELSTEKLSYMAFLSAVDVIAAGIMIANKQA